MSARAPCPQCDVLHVVEPPPLGEARFVATCSHCGAVWAPEIERVAGPRARCREHPERLADWVCDACATAWCETCSRGPRSPAVGGRLSPCCRALCLPLARGRVLRPFWDEPRAVLAYPLRGDGPITLGLLFIGTLVPVVSWVVLFLVAAYLVHVLRTSSRRPEEGVGFPDFDSLVSDVLLPLVRLIAAVLVAWGPLLLYLRFFEVGSRSSLVTGTLAVAGALAGPAAVLLVVVGRSLAALVDVAGAARVVRRILPDYLAATAALGAVGLAQYGLVVTGVRGGDLLALAARAGELYLAVVAFHLLGRLAWQTRDRVDWEM